jgi:hypothetical protein
MGRSTTSRRNSIRTKNSIAAGGSRLDSSRPSREMAIAWAEEERKHIEEYKAR